MALCPIFGPKLSVFCMLISIWGVIQLALMGVFFYIRSVALIEDIALSEESMKSPQTFLTEVNVRYDNSAKNCFVAACLYVVTMLFSIWQFLANRRVTAQKSLSTAGAGPFIPESSYQTTRSRREWGTRRLTPSGAAGNTGRRYGGAVLSQLDDDDESPLLKSTGGRSERQPLLSSARNRR